MIKEIWRDISSYEGIYQVSNLGNVKNQNKILNPNKLKSGYLQIGLYKEKIKKMFLVHRLVAFAFLENPEYKKEVNHKDRNPKNNTLENLEWVTRQENMDHCNKDGMSEKQIISRKLSGEKSIGINILEKRPVQGYVNDQLVYEFESMMCAEKQLKIKHSNISNCCNKKESKSAGKLNGNKIIWKFKEAI